jgi:hypothetical protein
VSVQGRGRLLTLSADRGAANRTVGTLGDRPRLRIRYVRRHYVLRSDRFVALRSLVRSGEPAPGKNRVRHGDTDEECGDQLKEAAVQIAYGARRCRRGSALAGYADYGRGWSLCEDMCRDWGGCVLAPDEPIRERYGTAPSGPVLRLLPLRCVR